MSISNYNIYLIFILNLYYLPFVYTVFEAVTSPKDQHFSKFVRRLDNVEYGISLFCYAYSTNQSICKIDFIYSKKNLIYK